VPWEVRALRCLRPLGIQAKLLAHEQTGRLRVLAPR
jgi:hypothetical protein